MNRTRLFICTLFAFSALFFISCEPTDNPNQDPTDDPVGPSIDPEEYEQKTLYCFIDAAEGSTGKITLTANGTWDIDNHNPELVSISPMEGDSGTCELTITALKANESLKESVYLFRVKGDDRASICLYYIVQRGTKGIEIDQADMTISGAQDFIRIPYKGNYGLEEMTFSSTNPAYEFIGIDTTAAAEVLIEDKETALVYSEYTEGEIVFMVTEQNLGTDDIESVIDITAGNAKFPINVTQVPYTVEKPDFSREFFRTSVIYEVGGTNCGNCPVMQYQIYKAKKEMPGRLVVINCQFTGYPSDFLPMYTMYQDVWKTQWRPSAYFNNYAYVHNFSDGDTQLYMYKALVDEAVSCYPSNVGISAKAILSEDRTKMDIDINLAAKNDDKPYYITVFILEDNVMTQQSGSESIQDPNFDANNHQGVLRASLTEQIREGGDWIMDLTAGEVCTINYKGLDVPEDIIDIDNMRIAIIITTPGFVSEDEGLVGNAKYEDSGFIVDNAALFPINGAVDFRYE